MSQSKSCPKCGTEFAVTELNGLCPVCLFAGARQQDPGDSVESEPTRVHGSATPKDPFTAESLSRRIPQLEFLRLLGRGGMGVVYLARQKSLDRLVAVKVIRPDIREAGDFALRFAREARALARLNHPHIVGVHDFGSVPITEAQPSPGEEQSPRLFFLVMEYVEGTNLRSLISSRQISPSEALVIVPQICQALQFAHDQGIIHRDIKPENILIDRQGAVKIADFGLAKLASDAVDWGLTGTQQLMGTPRYMAPEQLERSRAVDHRADIYSLGVVFYELLTGELPIGAFDPPSQRIQVDVRLDQVVLKALAQQPEKRYQLASDVKTDLDVITHPGSKDSNAKAEGEPANSKASSNENSFRDAASNGLQSADNHLAIDGKEDTLFSSVRYFPRDAREWGMSVYVEFVLLVLWMVIPTVLISSLLNIWMWRWPTILSLLIGLGFIAVTNLVVFSTFAISSVHTAAIDRSGMRFSRFLGPDTRLKWSEIEEIDPISDYQCLLEFVLWPGILPRGAILSQSYGHFYRIRIGQKCWYHAPRDIDAWERAIHFVAKGKLNPQLKSSARSRLWIVPVAILSMGILLSFGMAHAFLWRLEKPGLPSPVLDGPETSVIESGPSVPMKPWTIDSLRVELTEPFAKYALELDPDELESVNQILSDSQRKFLELESQHLKRETREDGRIIIHVEAAPEWVASLKAEIWTRLDQVLTPEQQRIARLNLKLDPLPEQANIAVQDLVAPGFFGWCQDGATIEIWKVGSWWHWRVQTRGYDFDSEAPELPAAMARFGNPENIRIDSPAR